MAFEIPCCAIVCQIDERIACRNKKSRQTNEKDHHWGAKQWKDLARVIEIGKETL